MYFNWGVISVVVLLLLFVCLFVFPQGMPKKGITIFPNSQLTLVQCSSSPHSSCHVTPPAKHCPAPPRLPPGAPVLHRSRPARGEHGGASMAEQLLSVCPGEINGRAGINECGYSTANLAGSYESARSEYKDELFISLNSFRLSAFIGSYKFLYLGRQLAKLTAPVLFSKLWWQYAFVQHRNVSPIRSQFSVFTVIKTWKVIDDFS